MTSAPNGKGKEKWNNLISQKSPPPWSKAQKAFGPALKSSSNPHFRSKYADLSACVEAVIDALNNNGIALTQQVHECDNGVDCAKPCLFADPARPCHAVAFMCPPPNQDAQGYGSALSLCPPVQPDGRLRYCAGR